MINRLVLLAAVVVASVGLASAQLESGSFTDPYGWNVGDRSSGELSFQGGAVKVSMEVKSSTNSGRSYYVVTFRNTTSSTISFGARVTDEDADETSFRLTIPAGESRRWGEHLDAKLRWVYVIVGSVDYR